MLVIIRQSGKEFMLPEDVVEQERVYVPYGLAVFLGVVPFWLISYHSAGEKKMKPSVKQIRD